MKKIFKLGFILGLILMVTGCVKVEFSMGIHKDKSMDMKIIEAFDESFFGGDETAIDNKDIEDIEEQGFLVREYNEGSMKGYIFTKTFENIDFLSTEEVGYVADFNKVFEQPNVILFTKQKGFFKNTYSAKFDISSDGLTGDTNTELPDDFDYSELINSMEMNFIVEVPYKVVSTNAKTISDDERVLTWNLLEISNQPLEFEFYLYNMTNVYIVGGILLIVLFWIIVLICKIVGSRKSSNNGNYTNNNFSNPVYYSNNNINDENVNNSSFVDKNVEITNTFINPINNSINNDINTFDNNSLDNNYFNSQSFGINIESQSSFQDDNNFANNVPLSELSQSNVNNQVNNSNNDFVSLGLDSISYNDNQVSSNQTNMVQNTESNSNIFIQDVDKFN